MAHRWHTRSVAVGEPAREVRLFAAGENTSTKGVVIFDAIAAKAVMAAAAEHGVDCMIDLEHLSLDTESRSFDPDARGWGRLEVRNGELWLVDIHWNPDGEARLREKRQRYVSPAFRVDPKTQRVQRVLNVAITALPATDSAMPLIAANEGHGHMDPKLIKAALDALEAGDSAKALEILKALIASAAGASADAPPPADQMADDPDPAKKEEEQIAASARRITGKQSALEVEAVLTALSVTRETASGQSSELTTLRDTVRTMQLRELVRDNPRKIASPKLEALVLASQNVDVARALIDALPEVVGSAVAQKPKPATESEEIRLTEEDKAVARLTGHDPAKVLEFKRKAAQR